MKFLRSAQRLLLCLLAWVATLAHSQVEVVDPNEAGLRRLSLEKDLDWLALAGELEADGVDAGLVYEALLARFSLGEDVDSLIAVYGEVAERGIELPVGEGRLFPDESARDGFVAALAALQADQWGNVETLRSFSRVSRLRNPVAFEMFDLADPLEEARGKSPGGEKRATVSLDTILNRAGKGSVTIGDLVEGQKGAYLDFWASWCGPCIRAMPELKVRASRYAPQGLSVVGVNTDSDEPKKKSAAMAERFSMTMPWLVEPSDEPLSGPLSITSIPRVVLIDPSGKVLFNGHPEDVELKIALLDLGIAP